MGIPFSRTPLTWMNRAPLRVFVTEIRTAGPHQFRHLSARTAAELWPQ